MSGNWKIVTGDDGKEYFEVSAQVFLSPNAAAPQDRGFGLGFSSLGVAFDETASAFQSFTEAAHPPEPPEPTGRFENLDFS